MIEIRLKAPEQAPLFSVTDIHNNRINLEDYKNKKLLLCFFRYAGCPFCGVTVLKLIEIFPTLAQKGLEVIAFVQSPKSSIKKYIEKYNPDFPIIADPEKKVYDLYKIPSNLLGWPRSMTHIPEVLYSMANGGIGQGKMDGDLNLIPASFLIGPPEFTIYLAHYGTTFLDVFLMDDINEFVENVNK